MQRRTLLKLGAASAAVLLVAGGTAALLQPGITTGGILSTSGQEVFSAVGRAVLDKTLPADDGARQVALNGLLNRVDALVQALPLHAQAELSQLLALLASTAGRRALAGLAQPWQQASVADIQQSLQDMRFSSLALRQQAYAALHDITAGAYFTDPESWALLGYPGPMKI